jgi:post-segregation antitoxin (ccd killing protein)
MQVYLSDELYKMVKMHHLRASELLQDAVRAELRRQRLLAETDRYVDDLVAQVGKPTARQRARAKSIVQQIGARKRRKAG